MTARQPRRARRRAVPANTLPRPVAGFENGVTQPELEEQPAAATTAGVRRAPTVHHREHHVTTDYSHVHKDLMMIAIIGAFVVAFIVGMSFVVG